MKSKAVPASPELFQTKDVSNHTGRDDHAPLAHRMRPQKLGEVIGQNHLLAKDKLLHRLIQSQRLVSAILYGPPGTGKTTLALIIAKETKAHFTAMNAVTANLSDLRKVLQEARRLKRLQRSSLLFIDEIHRFNKAQQDVLMPDVENGTLVLIGATTHNPSFSVNSPLLSRSVIFELKPLDEEDMKALLTRTVRDKERGIGRLKVQLSDEALNYLVKSASGDARRALNALEVGCLTTPVDKDGSIQFDLTVAEQSTQMKMVRYDRDGDQHYNTISAFIKSIRGSDPDAALYWLAKMITAGEDHRFIIRRLIILASEDIGNADPQGLILATSALQALEFIGMPESQIILAQVVTYLSCTPKSNASYQGILSALEEVKKESHREVPAHLRDAHYPAAKKMGHGLGYLYPHNYENGAVSQEYMPTPKTFYSPTSRGYEKRFKDYLESLASKPL